MVACPSWKLRSRSERGNGYQTVAHAEGGSGRGRVAKVVSKWTGIPVTKMLESEREKLVTMEDRLRDRVIGQDEALSRWPMLFAARAPD